MRKHRLKETNAWPPARPRAVEERDRLDESVDAKDLRRGRFLRAHLRARGVRLHDCGLVVSRRRLHGDHHRVRGRGAHAWSGYRLLDIHTEVHQVHQHLPQLYRIALDLRQTANVNAATGVLQASFKIGNGQTSDVSS